MDSLIELILEPVFDRFVLRIKQMKARVIFRTYSKRNKWINGKLNDRTYREIILSTESLLNLFLNKEYRNNNLRDEETRATYIENIKKAIQKK